MEEYIGKICPYCNTEIQAGEAVTVCPACGQMHHTACWEANKSCAVCGYAVPPLAPVVEAPAAAPVVEAPKADLCVNCGAPLADGQEFCAKCGTPRPAAQKRFCSKCGAELADGQDFCARCGQKADLLIDAGVSAAVSQFNADLTKANEKKKKLLPMILGIAGGAIALIVLAILLLSPKKPSSITVSQSSVTIERGETITLDYTVNPTKASEYTVSWDTSDSSVATVNNGVVTAKSTGHCTITVETDNGKSSTCSVTVTMPAKEAKVVKTWKIKYMANLDTKKTITTGLSGWKFCLYDDNTGKLDYDSDSDLEFTWNFDHVGEDGDYCYKTNQGKLAFIYVLDKDELWVYLMLDNDWCLVCN